MAENLLGILLAGGLAAQDAAWASDAFVSLASAAAREDDARLHAARRQRDLAVQRTFAELPAGRFPSLSAYAAQMVAGNSRQRLAFALDAMLDGLLARAPGS